MKTHMDGAARIAAERKRQISMEGWTPEHDDQHTRGELAAAAIHYASPFPIKAKSLISGEYEAIVWPWGEPDVPKPKDRISDLVRAGAMIAAEIDRLERISTNGGAA